MRCCTVSVKLGLDSEGYCSGYAIVVTQFNLSMERVPKNLSSVHPPEGVIGSGANLVRSKKLCLVSFSGLIPRNYPSTFLQMWISFFF
jgi:hypothetical protein